MELKSLIRPQLWNAISNSYIAENYKTAILDAMRYLSKIIREKSGLDGDGVPLVGQAFGGDEPKLRLNRLQTQSERDEQKGFQSIIAGLYSAIRNPRTHDEDIKDDVNAADPIIYFINHVLNVIDVAKPPFTVEDFLPRIFDEGFVQKRIYVSELVKEIPKNKYFETLIAIYRRKDNKHARAIAFVVQEIIPLLNEAETKEFMDVVSAELDLINDEDMISMNLRLLPKELWSRVKLTAKMRIENKLIASVNTGRASLYFPRKSTGALGTWATKIIYQFTLKEELTNAIASSLKINNYLYNRYVLLHFLTYLPDLFEKPAKHKYWVTAMKNVIQAGDAVIKEKLLEFLISCSDEWRDFVRDEFLDWTDPEKPEYYLVDGSPFLGKVPYVALEENEDEDLPF